MTLDRIVLAVLLALVPLRAMIAETPSFETPAMVRSLEAPAGATPATTFVLNAVIAAAALTVLGARLWRGGPGWRATGAEIGAALLLAAGALSTLRAGQKHLALIGAIDFLGLWLYLITLRQLVTRPWHVRLVLAVVVAAGGLMAAKCAYQLGYELPETIAYYEEHKEEILRSAGGTQSGFVHDYEQRLRSGAATGYFAHSNVLGSFLILACTAGLAAAAARIRKRAPAAMVVPGLIAAGAVVALWHTHSKGAMAALAGSILLGLIGLALRKQLGRRPRATVIGVWICVVTAGAALVAGLNARPTALGLSMTYRWLYWRGAWDMAGDVGPWGVGANNFGRLFTRYKPVECPEDVEDPHSWVVRSASEWGLAGLAGVALALFGASWRMGRRPAPESEDSDRTVSADDRTVSGGPDRPKSHRLLAGATQGRSQGASGGSIAGWGGAVATVVSIGLLTLFSGFLLLTMILGLLCWVFCFIAVALERRDDTRFADDAVGPAFIAVCAGLIGFVVHAGVDLALIQAGAATTFFALLAAALAMRDCSVGGTTGGQGGDLSCRDGTGRTAGPGRRRRGAAIGLLIGGGGGLVLFLILVVRPASVAAARLHEARTGPSVGRWADYTGSAGYAAYRAAIEAYPLDGAAAEELGDELTRRVETVEQADEALGVVSELRRRDPENSACDLQTAVLAMRRHALGGEVADLRRAIEAAERAVARYPTSPARRLFLAELYDRLAVEDDSADTRRRAADEYTRALNLDDRRIYVSTPNRLGATRREQIERRIRALTESTDGP